MSLRYGDVITEKICAPSITLLKEDTYTHISKPFPLGEGLGEASKIRNITLNEILKDSPGDIG